MTSPRFAPDGSPLESRASLTLQDWFGIALGAIAMIASSLILSHRNPFFGYDELATWTLVTDRSATHMVAAIAHGAENNPPLYELLLRGWVAVFGAGVISMRLTAALAVSAALFVMWVLLRKVYSTGATAVGIAVVFFGAQTLFEQLAQARFYGMFVLSVALALLVGYRAASADRITWRMIVATFVIHLIVVFTHTFGGFYSAAILAALAVVDVMRHRVRALLYASIVASWVLFFFWVPAMLQQSKLNEPRSWIVYPGRGDLFELLQQQAIWLPLAAVVVVAVAVLARRDDVTDAAGSRPLPARGALAMVSLGTAVIAVVPAIFVLSRIVVPVFIDRYLLPSVLGWAIVTAHLVDSVLTTVSRAKSSGTRERGAAAALALFYLALSAYPVLSARAKPPYPRPELELPASVASVPVVVPSGTEFWQLKHYSKLDHRRFRFVLDWPVALDTANRRGAVQEYKLMQLYRDEGLIADGVEPVANFLCSNPTFLVIDDPRYTWFQQRIGRDSAFVWSTIGRFNNSPIRLVHHQAPGCMATGG